MVVAPVAQLDDTVPESSVKKMILHSAQQAYTMLQDMISRGVTFKSVEAGMTVLAKLGEINSKLTDEGDAASRKIDIRITGDYGKGIPLESTADVTLIEDGSVQDAEFIQSLEAPVPTEHDEQRKPLDSFDIGEEPLEPTTE